MLQCVAVYCSVSQCVAVCCIVLKRKRRCVQCTMCSVYVPRTFICVSFNVSVAVLLQCIAMCYRVVCCSVLQCVAAKETVCSEYIPPLFVCVSSNVSVAVCQLQCVAVCCSTLQCVAVCCSVLQCIAVCCSVLQCVAVCCSERDSLFREYLPLVHMCYGVAMISRLHKIIGLICKRALQRDDILQKRPVI